MMDLEPCAECGRSAKNRRRARQFDLNRMLQDRMPVRARHILGWKLSLKVCGYQVLEFQMEKEAPRCRHREL